MFERNGKCGRFIRYVETKCRKVEEEENDDFLYGTLVLTTCAC